MALPQTAVAIVWQLPTGNRGEECGDWVPTPQSLRRSRHYGVAEAHYKGAPKLQRRRLGLIQTDRFDGTN